MGLAAGLGNLAAFVSAFFPVSQYGQRNNMLSFVSMRPGNLAAWSRRRDTRLAEVISRSAADSTLTIAEKY